MCLYPRIIKNPKYNANKKNGGKIPPIKDKRVLYVPIGCQECIECRKQKARDIQVRLLEDIKANKNGIFIALTYSNEEYTKLYNEAKKETKLEGYDLDNEICKLAVRRFYERFRKKYKKSIRHWLITELGHGDTEHIHMHGLVWIEPEKYIKESKTEGIKEQQKEFIEKYWKYGNVWVGDYVNEKTINYMTKYVTKIDALHKYYIPIILASKGIGSNYIKSYNAQLNRFKGIETKEYYVSNNGYKFNLPKYYKNHIYTEEEKEMLWLQKLDKEVRFVLKKEIDISKDDKRYFKALEQARKTNRLLGYGSGELDWNRKEYERQQRNLKQELRLRDIEPSIKLKLIVPSEEKESNTMWNYRNKNPL